MEARLYLTQENPVTKEIYHEHRYNFSYEPEDNLVQITHDILRRIGCNMRYTHFVSSFFTNDPMGDPLFLGFIYKENCLEDPAKNDEEDTVIDGDSNSGRLKHAIDALTRWIASNKEDIDKMLPGDVVIATGNIVGKYFYGKDDLYSK